MHRLPRTLRLALASVAMLGAIAGPAAPAALALASQDSTVVTVVRDASNAAVTTAPVGTSVHAYVSVIGFFGTPTGSVTIKRWTNGTCNGTAAASSTASLLNGAANVTALSYSTSDAGSASFLVTYAGNGTYYAKTGSCTAVSFTKLTPAVGLAFRNPAGTLVTSVPFGTAVHPYVAVFGALDFATGEVTVGKRQYANCTGGAVTIGTLTLIGGKANALWSWTATKPGTYGFGAYYAGDTTYKPVSSGCATLTVEKATPTFTVGMYDSQGGPAGFVHVDEPVHAVAELSGPLGTPTGTVTIRRYAADDCSGPQNYMGSIIAAAVMDPATLPFAQSFAQTNSWRIDYDGDSNYATASRCVNVTWRYTPTIEMTMRDPSNDIVTSTTVGTALHPRVVVGPGAATGNVTLRWSSNGTCASGTVVGTRPLGAAGLLNDSTLSFVPNAAGTYSFRVSYAGNNVYEPTAGPCLVVSVTTGAQPTPAPTAAPKATPAPTQAPPAGPSSAPSGDPTGASPAPSAAADPSAPAPSAAPAGSPVPGASSGSVAGGPAATDATGSANGSTVPVSPSASAQGIPGWLVLVALVVIALAAFGFATARRRRSQAEA